VGVDSIRVGPKAPAEIRLVDEVAPVQLASWYFRRFACSAAAVCDRAADEAMEAARNAPDHATRRTHLAAADRLLADAATYIPLAAPVRWSLVSPRLTAFRPNPFARHPAGELIGAAP
jgi:peptide/nickel transport system substrate-binding protein